MKTIKEILIPVLSLLIICAVSSAVLAYTNEITKDTIAENAAIELVNAQKILIPEAENFTEQVVLVDGADRAYSIATDAGEIQVGYTFVTAMKGYAGDIGLMTALDMDGQVMGIRILAIEETPGLGMRVAEDDFLEQYEGKSGEFELSGEGDNGIQAITGATVSSRAVTDAVNEAIFLYSKVTEVV